MMSRKNNYRIPILTVWLTFTIKCASRCIIDKHGYFLSVAFDNIIWAHIKYIQVMFRTTTFKFLGIFSMIISRWISGCRHPITHMIEICKWQKNNKIEREKTQANEIYENRNIKKCIKTKIFSIRSVEIYLSI